MKSEGTKESRSDQEEGKYRIYLDFILSIYIMLMATFWLVSGGGVQNVKYYT